MWTRDRERTVTTMVTHDDRGGQRTGHAARKQGGARLSGRRTAGAWAAFGVIAVFVALMSVGLVPVCGAAQSRSEQQLIEVLASGASLQEKDAACAELKRVGTVRSVPVLAGFLTDPDLSHSARYALESMPYPEAGAGARPGAGQDERDWSGRASSTLSACAAKRGRSRSLERLLDDPDPGGGRAPRQRRWGGSGAPSPFDRFSAPSPARRKARRRDALVDAVLRAANGELEAGRRDSAAAVFGQVLAIPAPGHVRAAAYRGLIASADDGRALELVKSAIQGNDGPAQTAALDMVRELKSPGLTGLLCGSLAAAAPPMKAALIEALRQRGDPAAAPSLAAWSRLPTAPFVSPPSPDSESSGMRPRSRLFSRPPARPMTPRCGRAGRRCSCSGAGTSCTLSSGI